MTNAEKVQLKRNEAISPYFSSKELYAMWAVVCSRQEAPFTATLKYKLFALLTDEERQTLEEKYKII